MTGCRVVIVDRDPKSLRVLEDILKVFGCIVVGRAADEFVAIKVILSAQPDFVFLPGELTYLEIAKTVIEDELAPMLLITDRNNRELLSQEMVKWEFDILEKPFRPETLRVKMITGIDRHRKNTQITIQQKRIHSQGTTRNLVDRATQVLVNTMGLTEPQAFIRIQILSQNRGLSMREIAATIIGCRSPKMLP